MTNYQTRKEKARQEAMEWQQDYIDQDVSYSELADFGEYFRDLGRKNGLISEFKENGIL